MTDQDLLNMFIQERINMLIDTFHKNKPDKSEQEEERILQAEIFIENLPSKEKELVENSCIRKYFSVSTWILGWGEAHEIYLQTIIFIKNTSKLISLG